MLIYFGLRIYCFFAQFVVFTLKTYRYCIPDLVYNLNGGLGIFQTKTPSGKYFLIAGRMQVGKSFAEFNFGFIHYDRPVSTLSTLFYLVREIVMIKTQKPSDPGLIEFEISSGLIMAKNIHRICFYITEDPGKHVEKVNANICGDSAG